jgi:uncharacterized protein YqeY
MDLKAEIQNQLKSAMKSGDRVTVDTLRFLLSAIHNDEIKDRRELTSDEIQRTITTLCKQRSESIELFRKGNRDDLVQKEEAELRVLERFLPEPLTDAELESAVMSAIEESGAKGLQDLGKVMKQVMPKVTGRSDGKRVNQMVRELLSH